MKIVGAQGGMMLLYRFLLGGVFVSLFAVLGDTFKPKSFSGLFGAAPSIALAGLILTQIDKDAMTVEEEAHAMIFGASAMLVYSAACYLVLKTTEISPWAGAGLLWGVWFVTAGFMYWTVLA
jgi:uncharacterized membrane protein (GlpM family)